MISTGRRQDHYLFYSLAGAAIILLVTLLLPLGFDNDLYESMGWALYAYHGLPYIGSWDHNFPGIVFIHWASIALFGPSDFGFRLFDYLVHVAMAGVFYRFLRNWFSPQTSLLAVLIFALYYASGLWGLAGQRDTYAAFLLLGAAFAFITIRKDSRHGGMMTGLIGLFCGVAFLMRPTYVFFAIAFLVLLWQRAKGNRNIVFYLGGCALPIVAFLAPYVFIPDGLVQVYDTVIRFNLEVYSSVHVPVNLWSGGRVPIYLFAGAGVIFALRQKRSDIRPSDRTMFLLLAACALISPIMMGKYFSYHFEPFMLMTIAFAALGFAKVTGIIPTPFFRVVTTVAALVLFAYAYYPRQLLKYYVESNGGVSSRIEATYERVLSDSLFGLVAQRDVIGYVDRTVPTSDPVEYISIFPSLRWRLHRRPPTRFTSIVPLSAYTKFVPAFGAEWRREFLDSLASIRPPVIIVSRSKQWWPFVEKTNDYAIASIPGLDSFVSANYRMDTVIRGYVLYRIRK